MMKNFSSRRCVNPVRVIFVGTFFISLYLLAFIHLFRLQVQQNDFFNTLAERQYKIKLIQTPPCATIYDRHHQPLTLNKDSYAAFITPSSIKNKAELYAFLQQYFPQALQRLNEHRDDAFMYVKRALTDAEIALIRQTPLTDVYLLSEPNRFYIVPSLGTIIGFTDIDNKGIAGLEYMYDGMLRGKETTYVLEKDARSNHGYFTKETTSQGYEGAPLTLTIDASLQFLTYEELKSYIQEVDAQEGAVIILDPSTGDILAAASYPDFNPNDAIGPDLSLTKPVIFTEQWEFGSVMKVFLALAALEENIVTPEEIIDCENKEETIINGIKITTWKNCGELTFAQVIRYSNNIGTSKVSLRLGKKLYTHLKKCGFMKPTNLHFIGEQTGFITPPAQWSKATPLSLSFGYEVSATLLQLARAFSLLCNQGRLCIPRLIKTSQQPIFSEQLYSAQTIDNLRDIVDFNHDGSSAHIGKIPGYTVMGKTGSAYLISDGTYDKSRSLYTFVGIIEKGEYKRIIALFVKEPKPTGKKVYASTIAVPLFKKIAHNMLVHDQV